MHAFSRSLIDLYDLAGQAHFSEFPDQALRFLRQWITFDGAVLGMGETSVDPRSNLLITQAYVQDRDAGILDAYGQVSGADPVTDAFLSGLPAPMAVDCHALYAGRDIPALDDFSRSYGLRHLMLFGDQPTDGHAGRWMVLYRDDDRAFDGTDAEYLHAAWFHVSRAIGINRSALLDSQDTVLPQRASALLNGRSRIEVADRHFLALLRREWPRFEGGNLPQELLDSLGQGGFYRGRQIEVALNPQEGFVLCTASAVDPIASLTPGESAVARRFAAGLSHKQIARELGVSPHTVRSQITHLYAKLEVHDKAALAQRIMARAGAS